MEKALGVSEQVQRVSGRDAGMKTYRGAVFSVMKTQGRARGGSGQTGHRSWAPDTEGGRGNKGRNWGGKHPSPQ